MVMSGFEPLTKRFSVEYSNQLSYMTFNTLMGRAGFEPTGENKFRGFTIRCLKPLSHLP